MCIVLTYYLDRDCARTIFGADGSVNFVLTFTTGFVFPSLMKVVPIDHEPPHDSNRCGTACHLHLIISSQRAARVVDSHLMELLITYSKLAQLVVEDPRNVPIALTSVGDVIVPKTDVL